MDFTGRCMKGMVHVAAEGLAEDNDPQVRLDRGMDFAGSRPAKFWHCGACASQLERTELLAQVTRKMCAQGYLAQLPTSGRCESASSMRAWGSS